jgi:type IV pilus assembly protein PilB
MHSAPYPLNLNTVTKPRKKLGEILLAKNLVTEEQIAEAIGLQVQTGKRMGKILVEKGWLTEHDMLKVLSDQFSLPYVLLRPGLYDPAAVSLISKDIARRLEILPLFKVRDFLTIATHSPQAIPKFDEIEERTGLRVKPVLALQQNILKCIEEAYAGTGIGTDYVDDLEEDFELVDRRLSEDYTTIDELAEGSPVVNLVNAMIQRAVRDGASDIHIEPSFAKCRIRFRIDGTLYEVLSPKIEMHAAIVSRLKVIAGLDIAERRLPQDGRIQVTTQGRIVDLRFSSLPGILGEKIVLRVLDKSKSLLDIHKLGMTDENLKLFLQMLDNPHGLLLVTGPTGSGKSTTLYAALTQLNSLEKNIITIEDPVEYQLDIINQNQVKESIGLSFAKMLKHVLRQDPDIIMVGEIREHETAEIAIQAALTGHMVLSTLHTNDAIGTITRLLDMNIISYLLSSSLIGAIAQRLVRTVCPDCVISSLPTKEIVEKLGLQESDNIQLRRGRGCSSCYDSGYKGRMCVHEMLAVDSELQKLINTNPSREELENYVERTGMKTLMDDGLRLVIKGMTTIEEISRAVRVM